MKRFLPLYTLLSVIFFTAFTMRDAYSQPLLVENFDYEIGDLPVSPLSIWNFVNSGTTAKVVDGSLSYTGYALSNIGRSITMKDGLDYNTSIGTTTTGQIYAAFLLNVTATTTSGDYFFHFIQTGTTYKGRLWLKQGSAADKYVIGIAKSGTTPAVAYSTTEFTVGSTNLIVIKYLFNSETTTDDIVSLYVDPVVGADEPATATVVAADNTTTDATQITLLGLRQATTNAPTITIDGIRVANSWSEAVNDALSSDVIPPLFTTGYPMMANIDATQADLQVNMNEAGTAYYVVVPDGATAPTAAEVAAGTDYGTVTLTAHGTIDVLAAGTVYSATITGLTDKTDYDVYVVAEDDEATPNRQTDPVMVNLYTIRPPDVVLYENFEGSSVDFTAVSITGTEAWDLTKGYAEMNGYSGGAQDNEDWLISKAINLASAEMNKVSFKTAVQYTGPAIKVMISTNFSGVYSPEAVAAATWTEITSNFTFPVSTSFVWTSSGEFSLDAYSGKVYIAFVYESTTSGAAKWGVDDFKVTGYMLPGTDATLSDLLIDGTTVTGFESATTSYKLVLAAGTTAIPAVTYALNDPFATAVQTDATDLAGNAAARTTTIVVTASDGETTQTYSVQFDPILAVANIAGLRAVAEADYDRIYTVTGEVLVTALNSTQRNQKYVQDASAGVLIDDNDGVITTTYNAGDGITALTGTLYNYYDMLEFIPYSDPGTATSTGNTLTVQIVTVADFKANFESYEAELVKIVGLGFAAANGTAQFETKKNYDVTVGTDATVVRTVFLTTDLTGTVIPYMADVTGVAVWDYSTAKVAPRALADLVKYSSDATLSDLKVNGNTVTGFTAATLIYNVSLAAGTTAIPAVTATSNEAGATVTVTQAASLTGDATARTAKVDVVSHDKSASKQYTVTFTVATGIEDNLAGKYTMWPVPARMDLNIRGVEKVSIVEIFDVTGKKRMSLTCEGENEMVIPVYRLSRGVYFIRFITPEGSVMKRFVKE